MMFRASFGKPSLTFLCNHDAILTLVVEEGHYNTNIAKASDQTIAERLVSFLTLIIPDPDPLYQYSESPPERS